MRRREFGNIAENLRRRRGPFFMVSEDERWRSGVPWIVHRGACTITLYKMNHVLSVDVYRLYRMNASSKTFVTLQGIVVILLYTTHLYT